MSLKLTIHTFSAQNTSLMSQTLPEKVGCQNSTRLLDTLYCMIHYSENESLIQCLATLQFPLCQNAVCKLSNSSNKILKT